MIALFLSHILTVSHFFIHISLYSLILQAHSARPPFSLSLPPLLTLLALLSSTHHHPPLANLPPPTRSMFMQRTNQVDHWAEHPQEPPPHQCTARKPPPLTSSFFLHPNFSSSFSLSFSLARCPYYLLTWCVAIAEPACRCEPDPVSGEQQAAGHPRGAGHHPLLAALGQGRHL